MIEFTPKECLVILAYSIFTYISLRILNMLLKPLCYCIYYKIKYGKQAKILYVPVIGYVYYLFKSEKDHGDSWTFVRKIKEENPEVKIILSNSRSEFLIIPIGEAFCKDILLHNALTLYK